MQSTIQRRYAKSLGTEYVLLLYTVAERTGGEIERERERQRERKKERQRVRDGLDPFYFTMILDVYTCIHIYVTSYVNDMINFYLTSAVDTMTPQEKEVSSSLSLHGMDPQSLTYKQQQ